MCATGMQTGRHSARVSLGQGTREEVLKLRDKARDATADLKEAQVALVAFACTAGSMIGGPEYDAAVKEDIRAAGVPYAVTTAGAIVDALRSLGARAITVVTPHQGPLHEIEIKFFEDLGMSVMGAARLRLGHPNQLARVDTAALIAEMEQLVPAGPSSGEAIVLSCANMRALDATLALEAHYGVPVVGSNQAMIWAMLRQLQADERLPQLGRLSAAPLSA